MIPNRGATNTSTNSYPKKVAQAAVMPNAKTRSADGKKRWKSEDGVICSAINADLLSRFHAPPVSQSH
jgi:hypothetical protein